jgi:hypothetical protein
MTPKVRYPGPMGSPITPHGAYHVVHGRIPMMGLNSHDGTIAFHLMGGMAIPDRQNPERVELKGLKGLIAPSQTIDIKGATQDGVTFVDALLDPAEVELETVVHGRDPQYARKVYNHLISSIDERQTSELWFFTQELGRWWANVRWFKGAPPNPMNPSRKRQDVSLRLRADTGCWQSYPNIDSFEFAFETMTDTFTTDYTDDQNLGPDWPLYYTGNGIGYLYADGDQARWEDDPNSIFFTGTKRVVAGPFDGAAAAADDTEVSIVINNTPEYTVGSGAANDIWARMGSNVDGTWNGTGIRGRIGWGYVEVAAYVNFERVWRHQEMELFPPHAGEVWTLQCGQGGNSRRIRLIRDGFITLYAEDYDDVSVIAADHRGVGFGMQGGASVVTQATPGEVRSVSVDGVELDTFGTDIPVGLGANWPLYYEGRGEAYVKALNDEAMWVDDNGTEDQDVVAGPYREFATATDNQVVNIVFGSLQEWVLFDGGFNDIWARMGRDVDGNWDGYGVRLRIGANYIKLSYFLNFVETELRTYGLFDWQSWLDPLPGEKFTLVAGYEGEPRTFKVLRNGHEIISVKESGTASPMGAGYRGIGFGMHAAGALNTQATPASIRKISAGDNANVTQSGYIARVNVGDQDAWDRYTCHGPGIFRFGNGPGSSEMVEFGPLLGNQVMQIRTDPRKYGVVDMTVLPATPQELNFFQQALSDFLSFASGGNSPPLIEAIKSKFGILPPQGNPYSLLKGRFSVPIPKKPAGSAAVPQYIKVEMLAGNADTKVVAALTPLRRNPY